MKEKILALLTESSGQYNLPKDVLSQLADTAPKFEKEEEILAWIESMKPIMATMQKYSDSRVSKIQKEVEELRGKEHKDGDLEERLGKKLEEMMSKTLEEKLAGYSELRTQHEDLLKRQQEIDDAQKLAEFQELKKRVAKEVGLNDRMLKLVEGKVNSDMNEDAIKTTFADCKKEFIEMGLQEAEYTIDTDDEATRKRAKNRVDEFLKEHPDSQM